MPVYREPAPLINTAPGRRRVVTYIIRAITHILFRTVGGHWWVGVRAAQSLRLICLDLLEELNRAAWTPAIVAGLAPAVLRDILDLVKLGYYILDTALKPLMSVRALMLALVGVNLTTEDQNFGWSIQRMEMYLLRIQARVYNIPIALGWLALVTANAQYLAIQAMRNTWRQNATVNGIVPALGFMELLVRIKAQYCAFLADITNELMVAPLFSRRGPAIGATRAVPGVIFCCAGSNNGASTLVVTTSQDKWWRFPGIYLWAHRNRIEWRPANPPVGPPVFNVPTLSQLLYTQYANIQPLVRLAPPMNRLNMRLNVIQAWQTDPARWANHFEEWATPIWCPRMRFKARCLRCQGLFQYRMSDTVTADELRMLSWAVPLAWSCNLRFTCAETIAHFYCMNARPAGSNTH